MPSFEIRITETPLDAATPFPPTRYRGESWDLSHLRPLTFTCDLETGFDVTVLVLFSCHCSHAASNETGGPATPFQTTRSTTTAARHVCSARTGIARHGSCCAA